MKAVIRERSIPEPNTGCWLWTAGLDNHGYGQMGHCYGHSGKAYRIAFEAFVGPIPRGMSLDHLCRVRSCVNPEHLDVVTLAENKRRGNSFAAVHARKTHCPHGHSLDPSSDNVRMYGTSRVCRICHCQHEIARRHRRRAGVPPNPPGRQK